MKKLIAIMTIALTSLPVFAELDHNAKYTNHDEVMRGTTFPVQDVTVMKSFSFYKNALFTEYSKSILEKGVEDCKKNNNYMVYKSDRKLPDNLTNLSDKRRDICINFKRRLEKISG